MKDIPPIVWCDIGFVLLLIVVASAPCGLLMLIGIGYGIWRLGNLLSH